MFALYRHTLSRSGPVPTLIEWDNDVPDFPTAACRRRSAQNACSPTKRRAATASAQGRLTHATSPSRQAALRRRAARSGCSRCRPASPRHTARPTRLASPSIATMSSSASAALEQRFPVTLRLVGDEFFRGMARAYRRAVDRPRSPLIVEYGDDFPDFIGRLRSRAERCLISPMSPGIEAAWTHAYHAADAVAARRRGAGQHCCRTACRLRGSSAIRRRR